MHQPCACRQIRAILNHYIRSLLCSKITFKIDSKMHIETRDRVGEKGDYYQSFRLGLWKNDSSSHLYFFSQNQPLTVFGYIFVSPKTSPNSLHLNSFSTESNPSQHFILPSNEVRYEAGDGMCFVNADPILVKFVSSVLSECFVQEFFYLLLSLSSRPNPSPRSLYLPSTLPLLSSQFASPLIPRLSPSLSVSMSSSPIL